MSPFLLRNESMKKIISILALISVLIGLLLSLASCDGLFNPAGDGSQNGGMKQSKVVSYAHFNTVSTIYAYSDVSEEAFAGYSKTVDETLAYYHKLFDIYYEYAGVDNIRTINKNAGKKAVRVDSALVDFLLYCKELYTLTDGKTNIMLGSVLKIWHDLREEADGDFGYLDPTRLPSAADLSAAAEHTSIDSLVIDKENSTVYISDPEASIDVGAIAKGYAVERLYEVLVEQGAESLVLNIGGNLRFIGTKPDGNGWVTGITNPDKEAESSVKCKVDAKNTSIVTSGDYERFFIAGDDKYHHIIDPATLVPADYFASVSIITEDSGLADALSTALFCMSYEDGLALVTEIGNIDVIWIYKDGSVKYTDGLAISDIK